MKKETKPSTNFITHLQTSDGFQIVLIKSDTQEKGKATLVVNPKDYEMITSKMCIICGKIVSEKLLKSFPQGPHICSNACYDNYELKYKNKNTPIISNSVCPNCGDSSTIGVSGMADIKCPKCGTVWANDC